MWNNLLNSAADQSRAFVQPVVEFNQLFLRQAEKLGQAQVESFNAYAQLGLRQLQSATRISDFEQAKTFAAAQTEAAQAVGQRVSEDAAKYNSLFDEFRKEFVAFVSDRVPAAAAEAAKPVVKATKA